MDEDRLRQARSFAGVAEQYERARPSYPPQAVDWLLKCAPGPDVIDLGAGTGKLTRVLVARGRTVTAVEPLAEMLAQLRRSVPEAAALPGSAERIPLRDTSADAVLAAQAFHWFDPAPALDEIHRVLRPGGVLGLLWNLRDDGVAWVGRLAEAMGGGAADLVSLSRAVDHEPVDDHPGFSTSERREFSNPETFTCERLVEWAASTSSVAVLDDPARAATLARVAALCQTDPELRGRSRFAVPYVTGCVRAVRR
jgi:SAM-dependent methyltransferase